MRVFEYLSSTKGIRETYEIYRAVRDLKNYAISVYGDSRWEDALDSAFFHILENFDHSKGDLKNYTIKVVKTVNLGSFKKEAADDERTIIGLDQKVAEEYQGGRLVYEDSKSEDVARCITDMLPLFIQDYKFFMSESARDRKLDYSDLFLNYSASVIGEAKKYLVRNYADMVGEFYENKKSNVRRYSDDRYSKSIDTSLKYLGCINGISLVSRRKNTHSKYLYKLDIKGILDMLVSLFYTDGRGVISIEDCTMYVSLSGVFTQSFDNLLEILEEEIIGCILSRSYLRVLYRNKGNAIYLTSTKDEQFDILVTLFGHDVAICFEQVVVKEVSVVDA